MVQLQSSTKAWKRLWSFASSVRLLVSGKNGVQLAHGSWLWQHEHLQLLEASRAICLDPGSSSSRINCIIVLAQAAVVISISAVCHTSTLSHVLERPVLTGTV